MYVVLSENGMYITHGIGIGIGIIIFYHFGINHISHS
jgi:hypothetical protein